MADAIQKKKARGIKTCPGCSKKFGGAKKKCDNCGHQFIKKKLPAVFKMYIGPTYNIGDETTDEEGTWRVTAINNGNVQWELVDEHLDPKLKQEIAEKIAPIYVGWRHKLLKFIPIALTSPKYRDTFYYPLKEFIYKYNLVDKNGILQLDPFTKDTKKAELLYRLWLLYKERVRIYKIKHRHTQDNHQELQKIAKTIADINKRENQRLKQELDILNSLEHDITHTEIQKQRTNGVIFDSDSESDSEFQ